MKNIYVILFSLLLLSCGGNTAEKKLIDANAQLEKDLEMYQNVWNTFLIDGDTSTVNSDNFTEDVVVVTDQGDIVGIDHKKINPSDNFRITKINNKNIKVVSSSDRFKEYTVSPGLLIKK